MPRPDSPAPRGVDAAAAEHFGRRLSAAVVGGVAALMVVLWGLFAWSTAQQFALAEREAVSNTRTLTRLVEAWALSTLERVNYLAVSVEVILQDSRPLGELQTLVMRQHIADPRLFRVIEVLDPAGRRIAVSDEEHPLESARNFDSDAPPFTRSLIGLPRIVGDRTLVPVLRPLRGPAAAGHSLVVEIDPNYFGGFSAGLGLPQGASVMLLRTDGPLLARNGPALGTVGRSYPDSLLWRAFERSKDGAFREVETDGVERIVSYRTSELFPLVVSIGLPASQVFAEPWGAAINNGLVRLVVSVLLIVAARISVNALRRRAAAERAAAIAMAAVESVGSGVAVVVVGPRQTIELANPAFSRLLDVGSRDPLGAPLREFACERAQALVDECVSQADGSGEIACEIALPREGAPLWLDMRVAPIRDAAGKARHAVVVMTDITERKATADELLRAKEEAEEASRAKSEFLANMSHELRTPLNAVIGFSDMIASQLLGPVGNVRYREYAELIRTSGRHLLEVISDILDLAKIEAQRVVLDERPIIVENVLTMCATLVASRAAEADVRVAVCADPLLPQLKGDELRVKQIVINLLSNAVKFSPPGTEVQVGARIGAHGGILIEVRDRGCGMSEEELVLAVQPFRQVNSAIAKRAEGTGLGLPLALHLTALHGGELLIDSAPGAGTTARVLFPAVRSVAARAVA